MAFADTHLRDSLHGGDPSRGHNKATPNERPQILLGTEARFGVGSRVEEPGFIGLTRYNPKCVDLKVYIG